MHDHKQGAESLVEVQQADIYAAIDLKYALDDVGSTTWSARSAEPEDNPVAKAFARHRIAATSEASLSVERMREALAGQDEVVSLARSLCNQTLYGEDGSRDDTIARLDAALTALNATAEGGER